MHPAIRALLGPLSLAWALISNLGLGHPRGDTAPEDHPYTVTSVEFEGLYYTSPAWVLEYLDLEALPKNLSAADIAALAEKLLTTSAFTQVRTQWKPTKSAGAPATGTLVLHCEEKWTLIPVLRAQVGGGTPLKVLGVYDTHSYGRLWTLGAEVRQYGDAPPGAVVFAKAPRWLQGKHVWAFELWRDFRRRQFYDRHDAPTDLMDFHAWRLRLHVLVPYPTASQPVVHPPQVGLDLWLYQQTGLSVQAPRGAVGAPSAEVAALARQQTGDLESLIMPTLVYDDVAIDNLHYQGWRLIGKAGVLRDGQGLHPAVEGEGFYYSRLSPRLDLASHGFGGSQQSQSLNTRYFLGGFDSIRGLPDGALSGSKAFYANLELRYLAAKLPYLWVQGAVFADGGMAAENWQSLGHSPRSSLGFGVRLAIPQIHRLMLRIDYAQSLERPESRGISAGLNELFQPYRPL